MTLLSESTSVRKLTGSCQCGAVTYAVTDTFLYAVNRHCSMPMFGD